MRRYIVILTTALIAAFAAGCTTQPAMTPEQLSILKTGKLVINAPPGGLFTHQRLDFGRYMEAGMIGGIIGGVPGEMAALGDVGMPNTLKYVKPYRADFADVSLPRIYGNLGAQVAQQVQWMGSTGDASVSHKKSGWGAGEMRVYTQSQPVNAVVYIQPIVMFSNDMKQLVIEADLSVYAHGVSKPVFLNGTQLAASMPLDKTPPALGKGGTAALAEKSSNSPKVLAARAKTWFSNDGERFKYAFSADVRVLRQRLTDFLNGHRNS